MCAVHRLLFACLLRKIRAAAIEHVGGNAQAYSDVVWTFATTPVPPLRLLAAERCDLQEQLLVTVPRHSCSMLSELRTVLAARFGCAIGYDSSV